VNVTREQRAANLMSAAKARQYGQARVRLQMALRYATAEQKTTIRARLAALPEDRRSQQL
jgi:hypothetical protein